MSGFRPKKEGPSENAPAAEQAGSKVIHETPEGVKRAATVARQLAMLAVLVLTIGWVFGVRFHPEALKPAGAVEANTVLELKSGQSVVGKIVSERTDSLIFMMEGSEVPFSRSEIKNLRPATPEEAALEAASSSGKKPFMTIRPEDTFQYKLKNKQKLF